MPSLLSTWLERRLGRHRAVPQQVLPNVSSPGDFAPRLWLHLTAESAIMPARRLTERLLSERWPDKPRLFLSAGSGAGKLLRDFAMQLPDGVAPAGSVAFDHSQDAALAVQRWHPDLGLILGPLPDPTLAFHARMPGLKIVAVDASFGTLPTHLWPWQRAARREKIASFHKIFVQDALSAAHLRPLELPSGLVEISGAITEICAPLPHAESERQALAEILGARPVWLAVEPAAGEQAAVIAAHHNALRHAHRMLLILHLPLGVSLHRAEADLAGQGLGVARRDRDEDPDESVQVLLTSDPGELGLWYRLAPCCFMGGTLFPGTQPGRSPLEPAALGSAVVHGAAVGAGQNRWTAEYQSLTGATASRSVASGDELASVVAELIAPDKAALLAHSAWSVTTGGAEVLERTAQQLLHYLREALAVRGVHVRNKAPTRSRKDNR